jgi:cell division protein FtsA
MPLDIDDLVFAPIASAQVALDRESKERGALVIDIGGGTTDYVLYQDGAIEASGCIPVGGDHITNDIHLVTGLAFSKAETLKVREGDASADPARSVGVIKVTDDKGFAEAEVKRQLLNDIIRQRLEETLKLLLRRLPDGAMERVGTGVFLSGGTSLMRGFGELAHDVFKRDIYRPEPPELSGVQANFKDPQFTTAIGLIRYAQIIEAEREPKRGVLRKLGGDPAHSQCHDRIPSRRTKHHSFLLRENRRPRRCGHQHARPRGPRWHGRRGNAGDQHRHPDAFRLGRPRPHPARPEPDQGPRLRR